MLSRPHGGGKEGSGLGRVLYQDHDGTGGERGQVPLGRVGVGGGDRTDRQREGIPGQE